MNTNENENTMHNTCIDCAYMTSILGKSGCTNVHGGHEIKDVHNNTCEHFKCEWCYCGPCKCKYEDFY